MISGLFTFIPISNPNSVDTQIRFRHNDNLTTIKLKIKSHSTKIKPNENKPIANQNSIHT